MSSRKRKFSTTRTEISQNVCQYFLTSVGEGLVRNNFFPRFSVNSENFIGQGRLFQRSVEAFIILRAFHDFSLPTLFILWKQIYMKCTWTIINGERKEKLKAALSAIWVFKKKAGYVEESESVPSRIFVSPRITNWAVMYFDHIPLFIELFPLSLSDTSPHQRNRGFFSGLWNNSRFARFVASHLLPTAIWSTWHHQPAMAEYEFRAEVRWHFPVIGADKDSSDPTSA